MTKSNGDIVPSGCQVPITLDCREDPVFLLAIALRHLCDCVQAIGLDSNIRDNLVRRGFEKVYVHDLTAAKNLIRDVIQQNRTRR